MLLRHVAPSPLLSIKALAPLVAGVVVGQGGVGWGGGLWKDVLPPPPVAGI